MPQVSQEQEELQDDDKTYHKRIEDLLEDAEIEAEIETEKKVRSKNTRLVTISLVAIALIAFIYLQVKTGSQATSTESNASGPLPELAKAPAVTPVTPEQAPDSEQAPVVAKETKPATPGDDKAETQKVEETVAEVKPPAPASPAEKPKAPAVVQAPPQATAPAEPKKLPEVAKLVKKPVKLPPASVAPAVSGKHFHVQLGVFSVEDNANRLLKNLKNKGFKPSIDTRATQASMYVVYLGGFTSKEDGSQAITDLKAKGFSPVMEKFEDNSNTIILGKFKKVGQAAALRDKLSIHGFLSSAKKSSVETRIHVVQLGPFTSLPQAQKTQASIKRAGFKNTFIR
jgi:cell division septation protein DedD